MKHGNYTTGTTYSIPFKCTQCGFFDPMEIDIAEEVCDRVTVNGILCFSAYCIRCDASGRCSPENFKSRISLCSFPLFFSVCDEVPLISLLITQKSIGTLLGYFYFCPQHCTFLIEKKEKDLICIRPNLQFRFKRVRNIFRRPC